MMRSAVLAGAAWLLALTVLLSASTKAGAQLPGSPIKPPARGLFQLTPRLAVMPAFGWTLNRQPRHHLQAQLAWPLQSNAGSAVEVGLELGSAGRMRQPYRYSGVFAAGRFAHRNISFTTSAAVAAGAGSGPRTVFTLAAGGHRGGVTLDVRTTWFQDEPLRPDSLTSGISGAPFGSTLTRDGRYADAELGASQRLGAMTASVHAGSRFGGNTRGPDRWLSGEAGIPLVHGLALLISGGSRPERPELAQRPGRFVQIALQWVRPSPAPSQPVLPTSVAEASAVDIVVLGADRFRIRFALNAARSVELRGDVTSWDSVPLERVPGSPGLWQIILDVPAGAYHIHLRVDDGAWLVPAGLVAVPDGFGGLSGILSLPAH
jgi:hypothetical protein